jgi:hypothetical protein
MERVEGRANSGEEVKGVSGFEKSISSCILGQGI